MERDRALSPLPWRGRKMATLLAGRISGDLACAKPLRKCCVKSLRRGKPPISSPPTPEIRNMRIWMLAAALAVAVASTSLAASPFHFVGDPAPLPEPLPAVESHALPVHDYDAAAMPAGCCGGWFGDGCLEPARPCCGGLWDNFCSAVKNRTAWHTPCHRGCGRVRGCGSCQPTCGPVGCGGGLGLGAAMKNEFHQLKARLSQCLPSPPGCGCGCGRYGCQSPLGVAAPAACGCGCGRYGRCGVANPLHRLRGFMGHHDGGVAYPANGCDACQAGHPLHGPATLPEIGPALAPAELPAEPLPTPEKRSAFRDLLGL